MREIVFRGKDFYDKWVFGYLIHGDENKEAHSKYPGYYIVGDNFNNKCYHIDSVPKESIGQFTGLYDKNNVRIFEGDIVKQKSDYWKELIGIVEFYRSTFSVNWINFKAYGRTFIGFNNDSLEVIGNIYDNPELIK